MQSSIALVILFILLGLEILTTFTKRSSRQHTEALVTGLVDFHKAQCYFSSTIQVAALVLFTQSQTSYLGRVSQSDPLDGSLLSVLATSGFIPIIPALVCIVRYGRQSRYILILSLVTFILATATLGSSVVYSNIAPDAYHESYTFGPNFQFIDTTSCHVQQNLEHTLFPICGSWELATNSPPENQTWIWALWVVCLLSLLSCLFKLVFAKRLDRFKPTRTIYVAGVVLFTLTTLLTVSLQFNLFSIYFRRSLISPTWSFGQIIAVVVWVPSVVEFLYIELSKSLVSLAILAQTLIEIVGIENASKYRYSSPLRVMRDVAHQSVRMANLDLPEHRQANADPPNPQTQNAPLLHPNSYP